MVQWSFCNKGAKTSDFETKWGILVKILSSLVCEMAVILVGSSIREVK